jgi:hypothetical protein
MKTKTSLKRSVQKLTAIKDAMRKEIEDQKKAKEKPKS